MLKTQAKGKKKPRDSQTKHPASQASTGESRSHPHIQQASCQEAKMDSSTTP